MPPDRLFLKSGTWYTWAYDEHGRRIQRSTRCREADRKQAEQFAREFAARAAAPDSAVQEKATLDVAVALLLADRRKRVLLGKRSPETLEYYKKKTGQIRRVLGDGFVLRLLRPRHLDTYVDTRLAEGVGANSIAKELGAFRAMLKCAKRAGVWSGDIDAVLPVDFSPEYKPRERWLPLAELERLLAELSRDRAARVAFIVATSARWGESNRAQRSDLRPWRAHVRGTKTDGSLRDVPLVADWQQDLATRAAAGGEGVGRMLFRPWSNYGRDLALACERAGIARCSPNDLRRTTGHLLRGDGASLPDLADVFGHEDSRMMERIYARRSVGEVAASMVRSGLLH